MAGAMMLPSWTSCSISHVGGRPAQGHEKGAVKHLVGYVRRDALTPMPDLSSWDALSTHLLAWCGAERERLAPTFQSYDRASPSGCTSAVVLMPQDAPTFSICPPGPTTAASRWLA